MITIKNLNKTFKTNKLNVINNTSLSLPDTGLITLLGESGSGKTTLLNVIGGLDRFNNGSISYDDSTFNKYKMNKIDKYRNNHISYIFQNYYLIEELSVYDNLLKALEIIHITDKEECDKRIVEALNAVKLYKYRKKRVDALSGGQRQRVAIARALIKKNKLIIADEPTGNLDSENSINIMNILKEISKNNLVLLVTHNKNLANYYSDYIYNISDGSIIEGYSPVKGSLNVDDNNIYLGDLTKEVTEQNDNLLTVYNKQDNDLKIELICINGTYYINSNKPMKFLSGSQFKIVDGKKEEYSNNNVNIEYSNSSFKDVYDNRLYVKIFKSIKNAFKNFKARRKLAKFFRFGLFLIGCVTAALVTLFIKYTTADQNLCLAPTNLYTLKYNKNSNSNNNLHIDEIINLHKEGKVAGAAMYNETEITFEQDEFLKSARVKVSYLPSFLNESKIIYGSELEDDNDIYITKRLADEIAAGKTYDKLIDKKISDGFETYDIKGILNSSDLTLYYNKAARVKKNTLDKYSDYSVYNTKMAYYMGDNFYRETYFTVAIVDDFSKIKGQLQLNENINSLNDYDYILNDRKYEYKDSSSNEIIKFEGYKKIGGLKCVGVYKTDETVNSISRSADVIMTEATFDKYLQYEEILVDNYRRSYFAINLDDSIVKDYNNVQNLHYVQEQDNINPEAHKPIYIVLGILGLIMIVYIYFVEHSKLISNIKNVGIRRAIGESKASIALNFSAEGFVEALLTTTLGYFFVSIFMEGVNRFIYLLTNVKKPSIFINGYFYLVLIVILFIFSFFAALPSLFLMRKTPSEIIAKYDI